MLSGEKRLSAIVRSPFAPTAIVMVLSEMLLAALNEGRFLAYRLAGFALLNLLDDPAWLAMAFC